MQCEAIAVNGRPIHREVDLATRLGGVRFSRQKDVVVNKAKVTA